MFWLIRWSGWTFPAKSFDFSSYPPYMERPSNKSIILGNKVNTKTINKIKNEINKKFFFQIHWKNNLLKLLLK